MNIFDIAKFYSNTPPPPPQSAPTSRPTTRVINRWYIPTSADVEWAWANYSDTRITISLKQLADQLGSSSCVLRRHLIRRYAEAYFAIARRRASGGDLF